MSVEEKEITIKQMAASIAGWIKFFLSKWVIIIAFSAFTAALGLMFAYMAIPKYTASVSFVLSNSNSSGAGGLMGLASQFGLDLNSSGTDAFAGDNIMSLMKSTKMVQQVLLEKPQGKKSMLNLIIEDLELKDSWEKNERTKNCFPFPDDSRKMTLIQDSLFREVSTLIQNDMLEVVKPEKDKNIYTVSTTAKNEFFAYHFTKALVRSTSAFYIETKTSTAKRNLNMLQKEADSIRIALGGAIVSTGAQTDQTFNLNPAYQVQRSGAQQSQVRAAALGEAYGEVLKNLEVAKITLLKETPLYQIIDEPSLPLLIQKPSKTIYLIVGGLIGGFLIIGYLVLRKLVA